MTPNAHGAMTDAIDSTADEIGTEVAVVEHQPTTLFRTDDPMEVVEKAGKVADALKGVLVKQQLTKRIQGREHVLVEGWTTLGSMLGVVPVCVWSRKVSDTQREYDHREKVDQTWQVVKRKGSDWEARVEARTLDGRTIGAAEATCSRQEQTWETRDDYALRSMAQTRATSKALRGPLGFIVTLAGYQATPAEEMDAVGAEAPPESDVMTQAVFSVFNEAYVASRCKNEVLLAKMNELGVSPPAAASATPADQLTDRVGKMTGSQARALTTWLQESTP